MRGLGDSSPSLSLFLHEEKSFICLIIGDGLELTYGNCDLE